MMKNIYCRILTVLFAGASSVSLFGMEMVKKPEISGVCRITQGSCPKMFYAPDGYHKIIFGETDEAVPVVSGLDIKFYDEKTNSNSLPLMYNTSLDNENKFPLDSLLLSALWNKKNKSFFGQGNTIIQETPEYILHLAIEGDDFADTLEKNLQLFGNDKRSFDFNGEAQLIDIQTLGRIFDVTADTDQIMSDFKQGLVNSEIITNSCEHGEKSYLYTCGLLKASSCGNDGESFDDTAFPGDNEKVWQGKSFEIKKNDNNKWDIHITFEVGGETLDWFYPLELFTVTSRWPHKGDLCLLSDGMQQEINDEMSKMKLQGNFHVDNGGGEDFDDLESLMNNGKEWQGKSFELKQNDKNKWDIHITFEAGNKFRKLFWSPKKFKVMSQWREAEGDDRFSLDDNMLRNIRSQMESQGYFHDDNGDFLRKETITDSVDTKIPEPCNQYNVEYFEVDDELKVTFTLLGSEQNFNSVSYDLSYFVTNILTNELYCVDEEIHWVDKSMGNSSFTLSKHLKGKLIKKAQELKVYNVDVGDTESSPEDKKQQVSPIKKYAWIAVGAGIGFTGLVYLMYTKSPQFGQGFVNYVSSFWRNIPGFNAVTGLF